MTGIVAHDDDDDDLEEEEDVDVVGLELGIWGLLEQIGYC